MISTNAVSLVVLVLSLLGIQIPESTVADFIGAIGTIISIIFLIKNQIKRPDVDKFFFKK